VILKLSQKVLNCN